MVHPARLERVALSDMNPAMWAVKMMAEVIRQQRRPAAPDNALIKAQQAVSAQIVKALDGWRDARDAATERLFYAIYDQPAVRALVGLEAPFSESRKPKPRDEALEALLHAKIAAIEHRVEEGGFPEAVMRILLAGVTAQRMLSADGVAIAREAKQRHPILRRLSRQAVKAMAKEQAFMLTYARTRALEALPKLLPTEEQRRDALEFVHGIVNARGQIQPEAATALQEIERLLNGKGSGLRVTRAPVQLALTSGAGVSGARKRRSRAARPDS